MAINLDHVTEQITVTDTATNADLTLVTKGTGKFYISDTQGGGSLASPMKIVLPAQYSTTAGTVNKIDLYGLNANYGIGLTVIGSTASVDYVSGGTATTRHAFFTGNGVSTLQSVVAHTASAVNYIQVSGATTGAPPYLLANGSDTDVSLIVTSKGAGTIFFKTAGAAPTQFAVTHTASAVNYVQATGAVTGSGPTISAQGSDTNADLNLASKGTGVLNLNTGAGTQVRIIDSGGTAVNRIHLQGQATGFLPVIASRGSDTNLGMSYSTQGTGAHDFYTAGTSFTQQVKIAHTASAVNYVNITGGTTGNSPALTLQGSDANVSGVISTKGTGGFSFYSNNVNQRQFRIIHTASSVNFFDVTGGATGFGAVFSAAGSDTNIPAVVQPKGTGALQAQQTDSTATGGNARGTNAVDWQTSRNNAAMVASGINSTIGGGNLNRASSTYTVVAGGNSNVASAFGSLVVGGNTNTSSGAYSFVGAGEGNVASNYPSAVVAGALNTAAGLFNFIGGGYTNSGTALAAVTTQSGTMNGTTAVTLSGSNASIKVGQYISGTSIAAQTYVAAISGTSLTLSQAASGSSTSTLSFYTPHGVIVGGGNNQATGSYSFIGGGGNACTAANRNVASGDWSAVVGGSRNVASGLGAFIGGNGGDGAGFYQNTVSGTSSAIVCGTNNTVSGLASFIGTGVSSGATGSYAFIGAGAQNTVNSSFGGIVAGFNGNTRGIVGNHVFPACANPIANATGVSQAALLILGKQTTDATPTVLVCETSAPTTNNQVILPNNSAYFFTGEVIAGVTGGGNTKGWTIEGVIKRGANAASTALVGTPTVTSTYADAGASTWVIAVTADTTNGGLAVTFTGQASTTIRTVAKISTVEMTF